MSEDFEMGAVIDLSQITRLKIRTELGSYEFWADSWAFTLEDDERTLHLHGTGAGTHARATRTQELLVHGDPAIESFKERYQEKHHG